MRAHAQHRLGARQAGHALRQGAQKRAHPLQVEHHFAGEGPAGAAHAAVGRGQFRAIAGGRAGRQAEPGGVELAVLHHFDARLGRKQRLGLFLKRRQGGGVGQVGLAGGQHVGQFDLVAVDRVAAVIGVDKLTRIHHGDGGLNVQRLAQRRAAQFVHHIGGVRQAAGFDQHAVRAFFPNQL